MGLIVGLLVSAVILGGIILAMEGDFPDLLPLMVCVAGVSVATFVASIPFRDSGSILGAIVPLTVGAGVGGVLMSAMLGMDLKRAWTAASIYLLVRIGIAIAMVFFLGWATG